MKSFKMIIVFLALWICCLMPVMGVTTYLGGSPLMSAAVAGTNEFTPGQDTTIYVTVQNSGLNNLEFTTTGTIKRDDIPTTAKLVTVGLSAGDAPVVIKSDPQIVGDINSPGVVTFPIHAKILSDATEGEYQLPLTINYTYLASSDQDASDVLRFNYKKVSEIIPITIKIKPQVRIKVLESVPENLYVGAEGYLNLKIKNAGIEDGKKAVVKLIRNDASPIIPADNSVFIGDFPSNGTVTSKYKVAISSEAENQTYPVDVAVMYENRDGDMVTTATETIGIPLGGRISFGITSGTVQVLQGTQGVIEIEYQNIGDTIAYNAQTRLSVFEPFQSIDDSAYLGDLKPGEKATARYQLSVDAAAVAKEYALTTEVRYRDALDNSLVSDTFNIPVQVQAKPVSGRLIQVLAAMGLIAFIGIGAGYYLLVMRKKK
jgi:hypothetical protein